MSVPLVNPALVDTWDQSTAAGCGGVVIYGGRGSSKTKDAACRAIWLMDMVAQNGGYLRFLCTRRFQNKVKESVYRELCWAIAHLGMSAHFEILATSIRHRRHPDAEFVFLGIERNSEDIKGLADVDIVWLEEAQNITEDQWNIIEPTLRKKGCQAWVIFNPKFVVDFAWKRFVLNPPRGWIVRRINYEENPFLEADYLRKIEDKREEDPASYEHIYGGVPLGDSELSIFKRRWLDACIDAHTVLKLDLTGRNIVGFDPADDGEDKSATADKIDGVFVDAEDWSSGKDELVQNAKKVWAKAKNLNATVSYDTIGVGAFVGGYIDEQNETDGAKVEHFAFHAGGAVMDGDKPSDPTNSNSPLNKDEYLNLKAQAWANTARRAMLTFNAVTRGQSIKPEDVLSFSSGMGKAKLDALFTELCVPWWVESEGKKRVVPKVKLKKDLGVKSHNLADAVIAADNVNMAALPTGWILTRGDSW